MGMMNSSQSFQRHIDDVLRDIPDCFVYQDDVLVFSKDEASHLRTIKTILKRLDDAGLTLSLSKCEFGKESLDYLGYTVSAQGLKPIQKKIAALENFPEPSKQKQLLGFLGALNYYRSSLPRSQPTPSHPEPRSPAQVLDPLYKIATCKEAKKNFKKQWDSDKKYAEAFRDAKNLLINAVNLTFPVPSAPLALTTDASQTCLGAALDQYVDGSWRPLGFWSKMLQPSQQKYTTFKRELLAIKLALRHFNKEFNGRSIMVFTDHAPILGCFNSNTHQEYDPVAMNAISEIGQWTRDIRHKAGRQNFVADMLSRPGVAPGDAYLVEELAKVDVDPPYVAPEMTMAALEQVALLTLSPAAIAEAQQTCPQTKAHLRGEMPKNVKIGTVDMSGTKLVCETSDPLNPRPLVPESQRSLVVNLIHHTDHPSIKETIRRAAKDYYWPKLRKNVTDFVKTCHPCQVAKQSATVDPGIGKFPVPDDRFSYIHIDVCGPLPESYGYKFLLTIVDRSTKWLEAYPMKQASASECCQAFLQWISRFGCPATAMSDNGNSFVSNLYKDITRNFNIEVKYTPAYHAQTNGLIERQHQTLKNGLKAALIDMGDTHREKWFTALPWVLLGKRVQYQPHLDASASQLVLGKSVVVPGMLLGQPGPPLSSIQTRQLLDELYKLAARPPVPTSSPVTVNNIDHTLTATHVYVKQANPLSLCPKFEGPFEIVSRPSRSTVQVKIGAFANGESRLLTFHWSSCKVAHMRQGAEVGSRPKLGRPSKPSASSEVSANTDPDPPVAHTNDAVVPSFSPPSLTTNETRQNSNLPNRPIRTTRNQNPNYVT